MMVSPAKAEMVSPSVSPEDGIDRYEGDHTQGPACAIACGAGTIYRNYLVPVDVQFQSGSRMTDTMMDMDTIMAGLDDQVRTNILILDACRNNPMAPKLASAGPARDIEAGSGLAAPATLGAGSTLGAGTLIAFATAPGQVALDGEGANSPFSAALTRHIGTPGLEVQQMLTRVRAEVVAATKGKQVPWSNSSLLGEVYLAEK